jgi:pentatricopeptide repeat protein
LTNIESDDIRCLENFNVVLSSYAERGDVNETRRVLEAMRKYGFTPNQDSYGFAMEVLGKDLHRRKSTKDKSWVHKNIEIAGSLLATMDEEKISPSADFVRNYVELLCLGSELGTATALIEDCLSTDEMKLVVNNKALYRVALENAEAGNIEIAKKFASSTSEKIPVLHRKIRSKEQRVNHLDSMRQLRERRARAQQDSLEEE